MKCELDNRTIHMFASFGKMNEVPAGGGQTSARRLKETLVRIGFTVFATNRHRPKSLNTFVVKLEILFWAIVDPLLFAFHLLFKTRKESMVLFIGYSGPMLPMETAIGLISKILGYKVVFFLKGGGTKYLYENGSSFYRFLFRHTLNIYDEVFVEGEENGEMIKKVSSTPVFYMPNYTEAGFAPECLPEKPNNVINLIYFGRIHKDKNILFIIDVFDKLCENANNVTMSIIGTGVGEYAQRVSHRIETSPYKDKIYRKEKQSHDKLREILRDQHIFLFPSVEKREGHSNSLNEAMAWGVVPVVSDNNFLPSIVGDDSLVIHGFEPESYVKVISCIVRNQDLWELKSRQVYERVKNNFTQTIVERKLKQELEKLTIS